MLRTCWLTCLFAAAVSTQTVLGQPAYSDPAARPVDPAGQYRQQLEEYYRFLQHFNPMPSTPATECTRYQSSWYGRPQSAPAAQVSKSVDGEALEGFATPTADDLDLDGDTPDCCEAPAKAGTDEPAWFQCLAFRLKNWLYSWQSASCQMSQAQLAIRTAVGPNVACTAGFGVGTAAGRICITGNAVWQKGPEVQETCPMARALRTAPPAECVQQAVNAVKAYCANFLGCNCCQEGTCQNCPAKSQPPSGPCPTGIGFPFHMEFLPSTIALPPCQRATADKPGCCGTLGCRCCDKAGVNQEQLDRFRNAYHEAFEKVIGCPLELGVIDRMVERRLSRGCPCARDEREQPGVAWAAPGAIVGHAVPHWPVPPWAGELPPAYGPFGSCPVMGPTMFSGFAPPLPCPPAPHWQGYAPHAPFVGHPAWATPPACGGPIVWNGPQSYPPMNCTQAQAVAFPVAPVCQDECRIVARDGFVWLNSGCIEARCSTITYSGNRDKVVLEGNVRLVCKKGNDITRIEAPRVVVDLNRGSFTVESSVGTGPAYSAPISCPLVR